MTRSKMWIEVALPFEAINAASARDRRQVPAVPPAGAAGGGALDRQSGTRYIVTRKVTMVSP